MSGAGSAGQAAAGSRVGIAGTGLIGASVGLAAAAAGFATVGWDADPAALAAAHASGAVARTVESFEALLAALADADVLVLAAPRDATLELLARLVRARPSARVILDVVSVKRGVAEAGRALAAFVPSHPIAGSERSGPGAARADLFAGKVWTLDAGARPEALRAAAAFVAALGARPLEIDAATHDALLAFTSHLPQLLAVALAESLGSRLRDEGPRLASLCGSGMASMTRLGASPWSMWRGVVAENSVVLAQELRNFAAILGEVADEIVGGDPSAVERRFVHAAAALAAVERDGMRPSVVETGDEATPITIED